MGSGPVHLFLMVWSNDGLAGSPWGQLQKATQYLCAWALPDHCIIIIIIIIVISWNGPKIQIYQTLKDSGASPAERVGFLFMCLFILEWLNSIKVMVTEACFVCEEKTLPNIWTGLNGDRSRNLERSETPERTVKEGKTNLVGWEKTGTIGKEELVISHHIMSQPWWRQRYDMKPAN